jgi:4-hydroxy-3-methylbut-2-enyl diphosphate reductase
MQILLANPRGFCAGVDRAIDIVERALELFGAPIYVRHEVVHNRHVVERLRGLGAVFVEELEQVPSGANGHLLCARRLARGRRRGATRGLTVFDATCPLVTKVHMEVQRYASEGRDVILIGHAGHPEVEGTMGRFDTSFGGNHAPGAERRRCRYAQVRDPERLAFVTQTTLSVDDTAQIVAALRSASRACDAAARRHLLRDAEPPGCREEAPRAVRCAGGRRLAHQLQLQSPARAGRARRVPGYLVDGPEDLHREWFDGKPRWASPPAPRRPRFRCSRSSSSCAAGEAEVSREIVGREEKRVLFAAARAAALAIAVERFLQAPALVRPRPIGRGGADLRLHEARIALGELAGRGRSRRRRRGLQIPCGSVRAPRRRMRAKNTG